MSKINPSKGMMKSANEQYHANRSIAQHGAIAHSSALAKVLLENKLAESESDAVSMANAEIQRCQQLTSKNPILIHKAARDALDEATRKKAKKTSNLGNNTAFA